MAATRRSAACSVTTTPAAAGFMLHNGVRDHGFGLSSYYPIRPSNWASLGCILWLASPPSSNCVCTGWNINSPLAKDG